MGQTENHPSVKTPRELKPLVPTLRAVQHLIDRFENRGIFIGGAAVCLLGRPRMTADVDAVLLVSLDELPGLLGLARDAGFVVRANDAEAFARRNRVVLLRHDASGIDVDISLGALPFEIEAVERSQLVQIGKLRLRLPTVEDLIILKAVAHRPQDLLDIQTLVDAHPDLDRSRIERWVGQFAELLDAPELLNDLLPLLRAE